MKVSCKSTPELPGPLRALGGKQGGRDGPQGVNLLGSFICGPKVLNWPAFPTWLLSCRAGVLRGWGVSERPGLSRLSVLGSVPAGVSLLRGLFVTWVLVA